MNQNLVIIPTYNERINIKQLIIFLKDLNLDILVVDDNSPDGTSEVVKEMAEKYKNVLLITRTSNRGYGSSLKAGFDFSEKNGYSVIATMDADFSHNPSDLFKMLEIHRKGILIGSRYINGGQIEGWGVSRKILSYVSNKFTKYYLNMNINDLTAGFRIYTKEALALTNYKNVDLTGYGFLVTLLHNANLNNVHIKEYPVVFTNRQIGESKMNLKIIFEAMLNVLKLKF